MIGLAQFQFLFTNAWLGLEMPTWYVLCPVFQESLQDYFQDSLVELIIFYLRGSDILHFLSPLFFLVISAVMTCSVCDQKVSLHYDNASV